MSDIYGVGSSSLVVIVGYGNKIGFSNNISTSGAVYKVTSSGQDNTPSINFTGGTINSDFDTITFVNPVPNGINRKEVWYKVEKSQQ